MYMYIIIYKYICMYITYIIYYALVGLKMV